MNGRQIDSSLSTQHSALNHDEIDLNVRDALPVHQPVDHGGRGLLVSSPIIIHLINRMRFRRIRWAAMEFLLKSQKRSRRKLIIEQLILLLLRCLLIFLVGLLFARFLGCDKSKEGGNSTLHVIVWDDTLSNSDQIRADDGQMRAVHDEAKKQIVDHIAAAAAQANSPQYCILIRLSELDQPRRSGG